MDIKLVILAIILLLAGAFILAKILTPPNRLNIVPSRKEAYSSDMLLGTTNKDRNCPNPSPIPVVPIPVPIYKPACSPVETVPEVLLKPAGLPNMPSLEPKDSSCQSMGMFPPAPTSMPPSAYSKLMVPYTLSSRDNPDKIPTMQDKPGFNYNFYSDQFVCTTPSNERCWNNDTCAQYGIGEMCEGPEGNTYCVCESKYKNGNKVAGRTPNAGNIVIGIGGVCTQDAQCCSKNCVSMPGQFSKMCMCPPGETFDDQISQCVPMNAPRTPQGDPPTAGADYGVTRLYEKMQEVPRGACATTGKPCVSHVDCSMAEACTPDGFCACQLAPPGNLQENKIIIGGKCANDAQCVNNTRCLASPEGVEKVCTCPNGLEYVWSSNTCICPDASKVWDDIQGKCVGPEKIKRELCATPQSFSCSTNGDCCTGEYCDPASRKCVCVANLHSGIITGGGKCYGGEQCESGVCANQAGYYACVPSPTVPVFALATSSFPS